MPLVWAEIFENHGIKHVSATDKEKSAYVLNSAQRSALDSAGIVPQKGVSFDATVLLDPSKKSVAASYYHSERSAAAERAPEPRMGLEFITSWLNVGDNVLIGNIGSEVFALKLPGLPPTEEQVGTDISNKARTSTILNLARKAHSAPRTRTVVREEFVRAPYVVEAALRRAKGECETPARACAYFVRDDGTTYLEVHHIVPLGEGGFDSVENVAALCPHCHRELHSGRERAALRAALAAHVAAKVI